MTAPSGATRLSPRQLAREALRVLPHLLKEGAFVAGLPGRAARRDGVMGVYQAPGQARATLELEAAIVEGFVGSDWLRPASNGTYLLTEAGTAWIARARAQSQPFVAQHQQRRAALRNLPGGRVGKVLVNDTESPLGWLRRRRGADGKPMLTKTQFQAGERLRDDVTKAQLVASTTTNWSGFDARRSRGHGAAGSSADMSDIAMAARDRVAGALASLSPEMSGLLIDVCCLLIGLEDAERQRRWPRRSAKLVLQLALTQLARHYGLLREPQSQRCGAIRSYGAKGFRPQMFLPDAESERREIE